MKKIREFITLEERWQKGPFFFLTSQNLKVFTQTRRHSYPLVCTLFWGDNPTHKRSSFSQNGELRHVQAKPPGVQLCRWVYLLSQHGYRLKFLAIYLSSYRVITVHNTLSRQSIYKRRNAHRAQCSGAFGALSTYSSTQCARWHTVLWWFSVLNVKLNSVALVRERTIPTERPPLVGEVSANFFCG